MRAVVLDEQGQPALADVPAAWDFPHVEERREDDFHLPECQVATWAGFVFINPDPDAAPFEEMVRGLAEQFAVWDLGDRLLGIVAHTGDLAENESYTGTLDARIPPTKDGQYRVIVRPDIYNEINEGPSNAAGEQNNFTAALGTLEEAMRKIDKETRTRFEDTFNRINAGLKEKFPKLFGGGHAYLEIVGDDILEAGVAVMARPPGKRNSSIHQLSGGEKALTAVALVFSIFDLNPAPFCLLDEVDAPLDEHNVGRFCDIVRQMSERVQFIFITHNKATMELASQLLGVTMTEPGCSRLVAVDVDEAVRMATA